MNRTRWSLGQTLIAALGLICLTLGGGAHANTLRLAGVSTAGLSAGQSTGFTFATNAANEIVGQSQTSDTDIAYPPPSLVQTASYNSLDQLTLLNSHALTFDADGNLTSDGARTYAWDAENRPIAIGYLVQGGKATNFTYDGLGRRVAIASTPTGGGSATVTGYVWCGARPCQARNAAGAVSRAYYAEGEFTPGAPSQSAYYAPDQVGSVRRAFTSASAPSYDNDPYGAALQGTAPVTDFVYAGLFHNPDSGLLLAADRIYDPAIGRWLSRDPSGEASDPQGNLYAYVAGNPISLGDPLGLGAGGCLGAAGLGLEEGAAAEAAPAFAGAEALVAPLLSGPALDVASALGEAMAAADAADAGAGIGAGLADDAADAAAGAAADSAAADAGAGIGADIGAGTSAAVAGAAAEAAGGEGGGGGIGAQTEGGAAVAVNVGGNEGDLLGAASSTATDLEELGGGAPKSVPSPKGATQFIFPNGTVVRFDIGEGQFSPSQGPHINIQNVPGSSDQNIHIALKP